MTKKATGSVNNGSLAKLEAGDFSGLAGYLVKDGVETVAYTPNKAGSRPRYGGVVMLDDEQRTVLSVTKSELVPTMVLLQLQPASEA